MAGPLGLRWPQDRAEIVEKINDFRDYLYNGFPELSLFTNVNHCIRVATFGVECGSPAYQGIVLPEDVVGVEAAYDFGASLTLRSRWREAHTGKIPLDLPRVELIEMAEQVCTERPLTALTGLKVFSDCRDDAGLEVYVEAIMAEGVRKTLKFTLLPDGWAVINQLVRRIVSVSLPAGRKGGIILAQTCGHELSLYAPHELVPLYRKFKVASMCRSGCVSIQGAKRFIPVAFDHDIVEVGSRTVLKAAGSMLKFKSNTTDTADLRRSGFDAAELRQALVGLHARHQGNSAQDGPVTVAGEVNTRNIMPGYHR